MILREIQGTETKVDKFTQSRLEKQYIWYGCKRALTGASAALLQNEVNWPFHFQKNKNIQKR